MFNLIRDKLIILPNLVHEVTIRIFFLTLPLFVAMIDFFNMQNHADQEKNNTKKRLINVALIVLLLLSAGVFLFTLLQISQDLNYWGDRMTGNGFWLRPDNANIKKLKYLETYEGKVTSIEFLSESELRVNMYNFQDEKLLGVNIPLTNLSVSIFKEGSLDEITGDAVRVIELLGSTESSANVVVEVLFNQGYRMIQSFNIFL